MSCVALPSPYGAMRHIYKSMYKPLYIMGGSPDDVGEVLVTYVKLRKSCRMSFDVGDATEWLENEL